MQKISGMRIIKAIIFVLPIGVAVWLVLQYISWDGHNTIVTDFSDEDGAISQWYPVSVAGERKKNILTGDTYQTISKNQASIDLKIPRAFDRVDMTVEYTNPNHSIVEAGILADPLHRYIELYPFQNTIIDQALQKWSQLVAVNGVTLLQSPEAKKRFDSLEDFFAHLPQNEHIGVYNTTPAIDYRDPTYKKQPGIYNVPYTFFGSHEFVTYIKQEALQATFTFTDRNITAGEDTITIQVYDAHSMIAEYQLEDDGDSDASHYATDPRTIEVDIPKLPEGVYRYVVIASEDVAITDLSTQQHHFVVKNILYGIPKTNNQKSIVFAQTASIDFFVFESQAVQTVLIDKKNEIAVENVYTLFHWVDPITHKQKQHRIQIEKKPIKINTTGYLFFDKKHFFDPDYFVEEITAESELNDYAYILFSGYTPPQQVGNHFLQTVSIDITQFPIDRKKMTYIFSAPYLEEQLHTIDIYRVQFDLYREPFYQRIIKRIKGKL